MWEETDSNGIKVGVFSMAEYSSQDSHVLGGDTETSGDGMMNVFSSILLWCASQLSGLASLAESAAEYPLGSSTTAIVALLVSSCFLWYCVCSPKKPPRKGEDDLYVDFDQGVHNLLSFYCFFCGYKF